MTSAPIDANHFHHRYHYCLLSDTSSNMGLEAQADAPPPPPAASGSPRTAYCTGPRHSFSPVSRAKNCWKLPFRYRSFSRQVAQRVANAVMRLHIDRKCGMVFTSSMESRSLLLTLLALSAAKMQPSSLTAATSYCCYSSYDSETRQPWINRGEELQSR
jgi:hypothetical protein